MSPGNDETRVCGYMVYIYIYIYIVIFHVIFLKEGTLALDEIVQLFPGTKDDMVSNILV